MNSLLMLYNNIFENAKDKTGETQESMTTLEFLTHPVSIVILIFIVVLLCMILLLKHNCDEIDKLSLTAEGKIMLIIKYGNDEVFEYLIEIFTKDIEAMNEKKEISYLLREKRKKERKKINLTNLGRMIIE